VAAAWFGSEDEHDLAGVGVHREGLVPSEVGNSQLAGLELLPPGPQELTQGILIATHHGQATFAETAGTCRGQGAAKASTPVSRARWLLYASVYYDIGTTLTGTVLRHTLFVGGGEMSASKITSDLLRGNTDTMILRLLTESDCYGYEIVKLIAERSHGEYELKEATMYSSVRRLEADGDITWYWGDESQGGRRKYFRITEKGRATYARNKSNWEYSKRVLDTLL
jgi:PadR family transcriptional regulator, regulatory protein PadR